MTPVVVLSVRPAGSAGATEYEVTAPPPDVGVFGVIPVPVPYVAGFNEYLRFVGATIPDITVMESENVVEPAALVAVTI
jgi:hypothetical protein